MLFPCNKTKTVHIVHTHTPRRSRPNKPMAGKSAPASYKVPTVSSSYHEKCIAPSVKAIKEASERSGSGQTFSYGAYQKCNVVAQEKIWSEHCHKEHMISKNWRRDWHFLAEYDYKGNPKPKKQLPEKVSFFATPPNVPLTTSKQFGASVLKSGSREIGRLEMMSCHRKSRTDLAQFGTQ